jgi:hypothetical protein
LLTHPAPCSGVRAPKGGRRQAGFKIEGNKWSAKLSYLLARDIARLASATQDVIVSQGALEAKVFSLFSYWRRNFSRTEWFEGKKPFSAS